jgi:hypothetical protein
MKIYIAGPMRGRFCHNFLAFHYWEQVWRGGGWDVVNPARFDISEGRVQMDMDFVNGRFQPGQTIGQFMERDLPEVRECDAIFLMRDWDKSEGAKLERAEAERCGKLVIVVDDFNITDGDGVVDGFIKD